MRNQAYLYIPLLVFSLCILSCQNKPDNNEQIETGEKEETTNTESSYDSLFAQELGADDYGMKQYVMAFLKSGPNRSKDSTTRATLQRAHLDNIIKMANEGKLLVAGPFMDNTEIRGIYVFNVKTIEEAEELTKTDPAIKAGSLVMELHPWYGPAALMQVGEISKRITKIEI